MKNNKNANRAQYEGAQHLDNQYVERENHNHNDNNNHIGFNDLEDIELGELDELELHELTDQTELLELDDQVELEELEGLELHGLIEQTEQSSQTELHENRVPPTFRALDFEELTLGELKQLVESTAGKKLPTAKQLRDNGQILYKKRVSEMATIEVFKSGYAIYTSLARSTVLDINRIRYIKDKSGTSEQLVPLDNERCTVVLVLVGDMRVERNNDDYFYKYFCSWEELEASGDSSDIASLLVGDGSLEQEDYGEMVGRLEISKYLTERQLQVVEMYFLEGKTLKEIGGELNISFQSVHECLIGAKKKILKKIKGVP